MFLSRASNQEPDRRSLGVLPIAQPPSRTLLWDWERCLLNFGLHLWKSSILRFGTFCKHRTQNSHTQLENPRQNPHQKSVPSSQLKSAVNLPGNTCRALQRASTSSRRVPPPRGLVCCWSQECHQTEKQNRNQKSVTRLWETLDDNDTPYRTIPFQGS